MAAKCLLFVSALIAVAGPSGCTPLEEFGRPHLNDLSGQPLPYIEPGTANRVFPGDENTRLGRAYFLNGAYGLAEEAYRRAVEVTPQNGQAWIGLAASYDRLGRYDLADRAYGHARRLVGNNYVLLNNEGYSHMLRNDSRTARRLFERANRLAPGNPTILNNLAVLDSGQGYFAGIAP